MAPPATPSAGGRPSSFMTNKIGPLTGMQWALVVGGAIGVYLLIKKRRAGAAAAGTTGQGTTDAYGDVFDAAGNLISAAPGGPYSAVPGVTGAALGASTGTTSGAQGATTPAAMSQTLRGSGFYTPGSAAPIAGLASAGGLQSLYEWIPNPNVLQSLPPGTPVFYQPVPGVFLRWTGQRGIIPGTPLFLQVPSGP